LLSNATPRASSPIFPGDGRCPAFARSIISV
jgi:hypothetical protein